MSFAQERVSLQAFQPQFSDRFIRHRFFIAEITPIANELDRFDATFIRRPALTGTTGALSFESTNYPGFFLRHQNFRLRLSWNDGSQLFRNDASFHEIIPGLAGSGVSFKAVNSEFPNHFLRHSFFQLFLHQDDNSQQFKDDATFHKSTPFTPGNLSQELLTLNLHNGFRNRHCSPPLDWDAQAAARAKEYAQQCKPDPDDPSLFMHCNDPRNPNPLPSCINPPQGESLAWGSGLALNDAAHSWYSEVNNYNFDAPVFTQRPKPQVGHFTQIVWKTTQRLGCASAPCGGQTLWVCRYVPPGNINVLPDGPTARQSLLQNVPKVFTFGQTGLCP